MNVPGVQLERASVTRVCRENRGDDDAIAEACHRLSAAAKKTLVYRPEEKDLELCFVVTLIDPKRAKPQPVGDGE